MVKAAEVTGRCHTFANFWDLEEAVPWLARGDPQRKEEHFDMEGEVWADVQVRGQLARIPEGAGGQKRPQAQTVRLEQLIDRAISLAALVIIDRAEVEIDLAYFSCRITVT